MSTTGEPHTASGRTSREATPAAKRQPRRPRTPRGHGEPPVPTTEGPRGGAVSSRRAPGHAATRWPCAQPRRDADTRDPTQRTRHPRPLPDGRGRGNAWTEARSPHPGREPDGTSQRRSAIASRLLMIDAKPSRARQEVAQRAAAERRVIRSGPGGARREGTRKASKGRSATVGIVKTPRRSPAVDGRPGRVEEPVKRRPRRPRAECTSAPSSRPREPVIQPPSSGGTTGPAADVNTGAT